MKGFLREEVIKAKFRHSLTDHYEYWNDMIWCIIMCVFLRESFICCLWTLTTEKCRITTAGPACYKYEHVVKSLEEIKNTNLIFFIDTMFHALCGILRLYPHSDSNHVLHNLFQIFDLASKLFRTKIITF